MYNLLTEPILGVRRTDGGREMVSLPEALAGLVNDQVDSFTGLMPHQRHAWFAFLVQLSAIALHRGQRDEIPGETGEWSALLRELTKAWPDDEPWKLVVEDVRQPAFMQPPVPEGALSNWRQIRFPAGLDILVTTKNHDVKRNRIPIPAPSIGCMPRNPSNNAGILGLAFLRNQPDEWGLQQPPIRSFGPLPGLGGPLSAGYRCAIAWTPAHSG